jgi:hypothetical protein
MSSSSDYTAVRRYIATTGRAVCCGPKQGPPGPEGPQGPPGIAVVPGNLYEILYNGGASDVSASQFLSYNLATNTLNFGGPARTQTGDNNVAIGASAGASQVGGDIAIGFAAGASQTGTNAIAIGTSAGGAQRAGSIAIGNGAGLSQTGIHSIAIGTDAGKSQAVDNSIAIGHYAGDLGQAGASIILNSSGTAGPRTDNGNSGFFVAPIRPAPDTSQPALYYDLSKQEIVYGAIPLPVVNVDNVFDLSAGPLNGTYLSVYTVSSVPLPTITLPAPSTGVVSVIATVYVRDASDGDEISVTLFINSTPYDPFIGYAAGVRGACSITAMAVQNCLGAGIVTLDIQVKNVTGNRGTAYQAHVHMLGSCLLSA